MFKFGRTKRRINAASSDIRNKNKTLSAFLPCQKQNSCCQVHIVTFLHQDYISFEFLGSEGANTDKQEAHSLAHLASEWNCFGKYAISVCLEKYLKNFVQNFPSTLLHWATAFFFFLMVSENTQFEFNVAKWLNIAILYRISPRFQKWYRKFNPTLLHWATGFFSSTGLRKCAIWVYEEKYLSIAILWRISPWFQKWCQFNPTIFHWVTAFFQKLFPWILNISPDF